MWLVLLLLVVAAGVAYLLTRDHPAGHAQPPVVRTCGSARPSPTAAALPAPSQIRLVLLNGTSRNGLAKTVKAELSARGFVVVDAANAPAALSGPTQVAYGPGGLPAATVVSRNVLGAVAVSDPAAAPGSIQVTLGSDYQRLATPSEMTTAEPLHVVSPSPTPCV